MSSCRTRIFSFASECRRQYMGNIQVGIMYVNSGQMQLSVTFYGPPPWLRMWWW